MAFASIVFRHEDMTNSGKVYVESLAKAAELAAKYRKASFLVDVINDRDEVALRWEKGSPDWKLGELKPVNLNVEAYEIERPDDPEWVPENRFQFLGMGLTFAFDTATNQVDEADFEALLNWTDHHGGDDIWHLIREARQVAEEANKAHSAQRWSELIDLWMSDPNALFIHHLVEYTALRMSCPAYYGSRRVGRVRVELAGLATII